MKGFGRFYVLIIMVGISLLLSAVQSGLSIDSDFSQGARAAYWFLSAFWALALFLGATRFFIPFWSLRTGSFWRFLDRHTAGANKTLFYWEVTRSTLPVIYILIAAILFSTSPIWPQDNIAGGWMLAYAVSLLLGQVIYWNTKPPTWT